MRQLKIKSGKLKGKMGMVEGFKCLSGQNIANFSKTGVDRR
jgi:hypothetical protein